MPHLQKRQNHNPPYPEGKQPVVHYLAGTQPESTPNGKPYANQEGAHKQP
jgi:hypothetical protein